MEWLHSQLGARNVRNLQTPACEYYTFDTIKDADVWQALSAQLPSQCDALPPSFKDRNDVFDGFYWTRLTSEHWEVPLIAVACYLFMLVALPKYMANREKIFPRRLYMLWNFALSAFSFAGLLFTVPTLLFGEMGVINEGWYASVCTHASTYGFGTSGFFVFLFIYSKLAELVDTVFIILRKHDVIMLQWYHHFTVLLYCWHAYSVRIGTGLWFASMNYTVHSIMYFYYGLKEVNADCKAIAKKFMRLITTMQLAQMVVGIAVTVSSVVYHGQGKPCYVSLFNSALGLAMYASYFVLFFKLYLDNYVWKTSKAASKTKAARD